MSDPANLDKLPHRQRHRKEIITAYHTLKAALPKHKKSAIIREVAKKLGYKLDRNNINTHISKVVREWEHS